MSEMPSQAFLRQHLEQTFHIEGESTSVPCTLLSVRDGVPMNDAYTCYIAVFGLPEGLEGGQGNYRLRDPQGSDWEFFMTPQMPDRSGRRRLEAVFHYLKPEQG